jgi:hypothetical protein
MNFGTLLTTVEGSSPTAWHIEKNVQTVYAWEYGQRRGQEFIEPRTFDSLAVYMPDIDISLVFAANLNDPFQQPWVQHFPGSAVSVAIWLRYRGIMVKQWVAVMVEGGRYCLPRPDAAPSGGYQVLEADMPLRRLFFQLYGMSGIHQTVDDALRHAGITVVP